jgi:2-polyprenyl-3-methyl-5-hydroxy-6-metoxy-1,4-benzoquinol methylase
MAESWDMNPMKVQRAEVTASHIRRIQFNNYDRLVDFGGGTGLLSLFLKDDFRQITLADASRKMLDVAEDKFSQAGIRHIQTRQVQRLSELESNYSAIATMMVLHHIQDIPEFFTDAHRTLEHLGILVIADLYREDGSFHRSNPDFDGHPGFDVAALRNIATESGFNFVSAEPYFEIWKEDLAGGQVAYPLFLFVAQKAS